MNLIKNKRIFLGISAALVATSIIAVLVFGIRLGIDMKGGTEWTIRTTALSEIQIVELLQTAAEGTQVSVKRAGENEFIIRAHSLNEAEHAVFLETLRESASDVEEVSFNSIGPAIGQELQRQSIQAVIAVLLGISLYIAWAFRKVSEPVRSWKYGVVTLVTLFHDVVIPTGLLAVLGKYKGIEMDTNFIVALLVVMGFSVHDTIVVFDRIRENLLRALDARKELGDIINRSVKETIARSINTSLTLILVLVTLLIWGPGTLFYFILTILVGTVVGTYSSICVASPLLYIWGTKKNRT